MTTATKLIPDIYPHGFPLNWRDETSGVLAEAVKAFLNQKPMSDAQISQVRFYLEHFINAPLWGDVRGFETELANLKKEVKTLSTQGEILKWLMKCFDVGLDPF